VPVKGARVAPVGSRRNDHCCTPGGDGVDQGLGVIGLVGGNGAGCRPPSKGSASVTSAACPGVRRHRARLPRASTKA
jgi:hypothetical protein